MVIINALITLKDTLNPVKEPGPRPIAKASTIFKSKRFSRRYLPIKGMSFEEPNLRRRLKLNKTLPCENKAIERFSDDESTAKIFILL